MAPHAAEASLLPQHDGWLPYFLLCVAAQAGIHSLVCYLGKPSTALTQFGGPRKPPATALLAHVYGVKNVYTTLIRAYAAYHITNPQLYELATLTFAGVLFLYITEMFIYRTVRLREAMFPFVNAGLGLYWMLSQRSFYVS